MGKTILVWVPNEKERKKGYELEWSKRKSSNSAELLTTIVFGEQNWISCVTIVIQECVPVDTLKQKSELGSTSFAVRNAWSRTLQSTRFPQHKCWLLSFV
jgi:hypothetical protein